MKEMGTVMAVEDLDDDVRNNDDRPSLTTDDDLDDDRPRLCQSIGSSAAEANNVN
jgi:hypothetical protein